MVLVSQKIYNFFKDSLALRWSVDVGASFYQSSFWIYLVVYCVIKKYLLLLFYLKIINQPYEIQYSMKFFPGGGKQKLLYTVIINRTNRYAAWFACKDVDLKSMVTCKTDVMTWTIAQNHIFKNKIHTYHAIPSASTVTITSERRVSTLHVWCCSTLFFYIYIFSRFPPSKLQYFPVRLKLKKLECGYHLG